MNVNDDKIDREPLDDRDERLQSLLRDVPVPNDLQQRLLQLVDGAARDAVEYALMSESELPAKSLRQAEWSAKDKPRTRRTTLVAFVVAASVAGLAFGVWHWRDWGSRQKGNQPNQQQAAQAEIKGQGDPAKDRPADEQEMIEESSLASSPPENSPSEAVAAMQARVRTLVADMERIQALTDPVSVHAVSYGPEQRTYWQQDPQSQREQESLTLFLGERAALEMGARPDDVRDDLKRIIERYPGTDGANQASNLIATFSAGPPG